MKIRTGGRRRNERLKAATETAAPNGESKWERESQFYFFLPEMIMTTFVRARCCCFYTSQPVNDFRVLNSW